MQVLLTFTMASRGFRMVGSGTRSTLIFSLPIQQTAFMKSSLKLPETRGRCRRFFGDSQGRAGARRLLGRNVGPAAGLPWLGFRRSPSALSGGGGPAALGSPDLCQASGLPRGRFCRRAGGDGERVAEGKRGDLR